MIPETNNSGQANMEPIPKKSSAKGRFISFLITALLIGASIVIVGFFRKPINEFGIKLMSEYGQGWVDFFLFLITAVSCTPIFLPVWGYALAGAAMGYNIWRLSFIMALGSTTGSYITFLTGRYFSRNEWVRKKFGNLLEHPWTHGRSKLYVTLILFLGTASPIPCDIFYAACGAKRYPALPLILSVGLGRFIRYFYIAYGYNYFQEYL